MGSLKYLDALLERHVESGPVGAGLRVYFGEDCVYDRCLGYADMEGNKPFRADTLCQMASMTKCIAVTAAMQLYEKGEFLLTDPAERFIPEFANRRVFDTDGRGNIIVRPAVRPVTVGNFFDMTSGITMNWHGPGANSEALSDATDKLRAEGKYNLIEYAKVCGTTPGAFDPGERFLYGQSHDMLGSLIEIITGLRFSDYLKRNIFDPLGIQDMYFLVPEDKKSRCAVPTSIRDGQRSAGKIPDIFFEPNYESPCGGLWGTLEGYSRFARCLTLGELDGVSLLGERTIRLMAMNRLSGQALRDFNNPGYGYGLGLRTRIDPSKETNTSLGEFGWSGAFGTWVLMDPAAKVTIVYFQESMPSLEGYICPRIRNIVYSAL